MGELYCYNDAQIKKATLNDGSDDADRIASGRLFHVRGLNRKRTIANTDQPGRMSVLAIMTCL